ncbi:hypothetical protein D6779_10245 [Candidatus Parcubacteria bacterium]|nr:MAG: hypothetical protein D6779_10245 [Candidatus Parcubacteria bacterium]
MHAFAAVSVIIAEMARNRYLLLSLGGALYLLVGVLLWRQGYAPASFTYNILTLLYIVLFLPLALASRIPS